jgi:uncharacterized membrane protein HdeD (DUF308 family)
MIVGGLVSLVTGLIMVLWPGKTLLFVAALIGVWLLVMGLIQLARAFTRKDLGRLRRVLIGVSGLLYLVIGAICLRDLFTSLALLTVVVGLVWTVGGAAEIASGFPRFWPTLLGLLSVAAGVVVLLWPKPSLQIITVFVGIWFMLIGVIQTVLAVLAWRRHRAMSASPSTDA